MGSADDADDIDGRLPAEAKATLKSLASGWDDIIDVDALQVIRLKGAMTNEVYQIEWPTNREHSRKVLVRIYGEGVEIFFDRDIEIQTFEFMSKQGQGPLLLGRFSNGRIEEFIRARDPNTSALIASKMKEFYDLDMHGPKNPLLWYRLRKWVGAAKSMCSADKAEAFHLDVIEEEITALENSLAKDHQRVGFCHNDLQYGNIMMDEETRSITIIVLNCLIQHPFNFSQKSHSTICTTCTGNC